MKTRDKHGAIKAANNTRGEKNNPKTYTAGRNQTQTGLWNRRRTCLPAHTGSHCFLYCLLFSSVVHWSRSRERMEPSDFKLLNFVGVFSQPGVSIVPFLCTVSSMILINEETINRPPRPRAPTRWVLGPQDQTSTMIWRRTWNCSSFNPRDANTFIYTGVCIHLSALDDITSAEGFKIMITTTTALIGCHLHVLIVLHVKWQLLFYFCVVFSHFWNGETWPWSTSCPLSPVPFQESNLGNLGKRELAANVWVMSAAQTCNPGWPVTALSLFTPSEEETWQWHEDIEQARWHQPLLRWRR